MDDQALENWLKAKEVAAVFLRELLPDPSRTPEQEDALTGALFARLAHAELLVVSLRECGRAYAAPELLAACKALVNALNHKSPDWYMEACRLAEAAVAKAEGRA